MKSRLFSVGLTFLLGATVPVLALSNQKPVKPVSRLAHMVFFTLKERTAESREKFVAQCQKYLTGHPGTLHISIGTIAEDVEEAVSVRDFDVALHLVFDSKDANAEYQKSPRHVEFVEKNKNLFAKVRVFDTYLAPDVK